MDIPSFDEIFKQIKINFGLMGMPIDQPEIRISYFISLLSLLLVVIEEIAFFFSKFSPENFLDLTQLAPCICVGVLSILKIIVIAIKKQNILDLSLRLKQLYDNAVTNTKKRELLQQDFSFLKYLVKYFFILNWVLISVYNFSSLLFISFNYYTNDVVLYFLPYAILVPFSTNTWYTWLIVYVHSVISGFICVLYYTTTDALYYILTSHTCSQFVLLNEEIKSLDENTSHCLGDIVKNHQYILKLSQDLEEIFRAPNLFNVLVGSLEICALGFNLAMGHWSQVPGVILFLLSVLIQMLMISHFGENLIRESRRIGDSAFSCKWYNMDNKSKKIILLLMLRSSKPQKLTAYKFSVISYESFTKIISTSWSYFTILRTVYTAPPKS